MGLGPSIIPKCKSVLCKNHQDVRYIFKSDDPVYEKSLKPWWVSKSCYNNVSTYWACDSCIRSIKNNEIFEFDGNYLVRGM